MQVMLETLRLMMMVVVGRSHRRAHSMITVLMVWRTPPMWMILGGDRMLMRMIGGRQEACRRPRIHTGAVAGRSAECCYQAINKIQ